jgi:hypothetical protein
MVNTPLLFRLVYSAKLHEGFSAEHVSAWAFHGKLQFISREYKPKVIKYWSIWNRMSRAGNFAAYRMLSFAK